MNLQSKLSEFTTPDRGRLQRNENTYRSVEQHCYTDLSRSLAAYKTSTDSQIQREIRNDIDYRLRRYHGYFIKERIGAHYYELGADTEDYDFEHLIPAACIRDLLLAEIITVEQAFAAPTVRLRRRHHQLLKKAGLARHTPDLWLPFKRYTEIFDSEYQTHNGLKIDPSTWTLEQHYGYFKV